MDNSELAKKAKEVFALMALDICIIHQYLHHIESIVINHYHISHHSKESNGKTWQKNMVVVNVLFTLVVKPVVMNGRVMSTLNVRRLLK